MPSSFAPVATLVAVALLAVGPAGAQPARPAPPKPGAAAPAPPPPSPIFPCRTREEVCFLAVVAGTQVAILFTNASHAQALEPKLMDVSGPDGAKLDLSANDGRAVMLTGVFDPKAGITKAELVEVAGPLASLALKAQLSGGEDEAPPAAASKAGGRRR